MKIKRHNWDLLEQANRLDGRLLPGGALQPNSWLWDYHQCSAFAVKSLGTVDTCCSHHQRNQPGTETFLRGKVSTQTVPSLWLQLRYLYLN